MPTPSTAPAFGDSDIPALMADMGIAVTVGGVAGIGLLDEADQILVQDVNRGEVVATATTLTIQTSAFPGIQIGQAVVVLGTKNFSIRERLRDSDGGLTKLLLGNGPATVANAGTFGDDMNVVEKSSNYSAVANDFVLVDSSAGPVTITIPAASANANKRISVKKVSSDGNMVTLARTASDLLEFDTSITFDDKGVSVDLISDGISSWVLS
jgi:hypothetical protein